MSDVGKSIICAGAATTMYAIWLGQSLWYLHVYWRPFAFGPVSPELPGVTNLGWFGILLIGVWLSLILPLLLLFRKIGRRESGGMIAETERGIRRGSMPGVERLRPGLE